MKKNSIYALMGAIALTGSVGFSSCSSAEEEVSTNPNYDPIDNSVLTQFVFNVSTSNQASTRQKADATQATTTQTFRGIQDAYLLPYSLTRDGDASGNTHLYDISTDEKAKASRSYDFANLLTSGEIKNDNSRRVLEMSLPVGTSALLFYGRATHNPTTYDANLHGSIDYRVDQNAQNTAFSLVSRLQKTVECNKIFDLFESVLNNITRAGLQKETAGENDAKTTRDIRYAFWWGPSGLKTGFKTRKGGVGSEPLYENGYVGTANDAIPDAGTEDHTGYIFYTGTQTWKGYGDDYAKNKDDDPDNDVAQKSLEEILGGAYHTFTTINPKELRSGCAEALRYTMQDLYSVIYRVKEANPTNKEEYIAKLLADEINTRFSNFFQITGSESNATLAWKSYINLITAVVNNVADKSNDTYADITEEITNFPANLNMPLGSTLLGFTPDTQTWKYMNEIPNYDLGGTVASTTTLDRYNYPAEIVYFGNSPLRVSDYTHETTDYPQTVANWDNDTSWPAEVANNKGGWSKNDIVKSTTRSVAMQKDINYGSALLKTSVKYAANLTHLKDNNKVFNPTEEDKQIEIGSGIFKLTGILVAGLPKTVGWDFIVKKNDSGSYKFDDMVFDGDIVDQTIPTPTDKETYTLVWDTYNPTSNIVQQNPVYVALEFQNLSGTNFYGEANIVRNNGYFYIIGTLDPHEKTTDDKLPTKHGVYNHNLPPYDNSGATIDKGRVFIQDHVTSANFVIGENSLKHAYVTIPDLRSSQISLGLSVDINWETGLTFDNVILGGN